MDLGRNRWVADGSCLSLSVQLLRVYCCGLPRLNQDYLFNVALAYIFRIMI